jgi:hypothetical protein
MLKKKKRGQTFLDYSTNFIILKKGRISKNFYINWFTLIHFYMNIVNGK